MWSLVNQTKDWFCIQEFWFAWNTYKNSKSYASFMKLINFDICFQLKEQNGSKSAPVHIFLKFEKHILSIIKKSLLCTFFHHYFWSPFQNILYLHSILDLPKAFFKFPMLTNESNTFKQLIPERLTKQTIFLSVKNHPNSKSPINCNSLETLVKSEFWWFFVT